ncbi:MAG: hypothetical protein IJ167_05790 [Lachnospiraceae bacterium]|nr:hypothetical protein [Lachnospiraceae bacterium]
MTINFNAGQTVNVNTVSNNSSDQKERKTFFAGNANISANESLITAKRKQAQRQAMKLVNDAWEKDNKKADSIKNMEDKISANKESIKETNSKLKDLEERKESLREEYGIAGDSDEQKDLLLLEKYQDRKNGLKTDPFTKEEISRLKELQNIPRTEYQNKVLEVNEISADLKMDIVKKSNENIGLGESILEANTDLTASQNMQNAKLASDKIMEALSDEIKSLILNEAKEHTEEKMAEEKEKAEKLEEEKDEKEEKLEETKEKRKEQEALIEADIEASRLEQKIKVEGDYSGNDSLQKDIKKIIQDNNLLDDDLKGIKIDFNF